ncbi:hypothetical protein ACDS18_001512 [Salmonella enterica]|nr:hypothetical protein [Salmonella enterica]
MRGSLNPALCYPQLLVVILVVLTERQFRFSLNISQLLAKAIPVRGAKFLFSGVLISHYSVRFQ